MAEPIKENPWFAQSENPTSRGVEMENIYFKDNDIKSRAFPPYSFCLNNLGAENKGT